MIKLIYRLSIALIFGCAVIACKKNKSIPRVPIRVVSEREIVAQAGTTTLEAWIESDGRWEVELPADTRWLFALPGKGNGDAKIAIDLAANPGIERRARLRVFTATDEDYIQIIQRAPVADTLPSDTLPGATSPVVTTLPATAITATSAHIAMVCDYPFASPAIVEAGLVWRPDSLIDYPPTNRITSPDPARNTLGSDLSRLTPNTRYRYKGYVITADSRVHYGAELLLTTSAGYVAPTPVSRFSDDFGSGASAWFFSPTGQGWQWTSDAARGNHLMCYPIASIESRVVSYAMLPPLDISAAATRRLNWTIGYDYTISDASRLEIVVSTDFAGDFEQATWQLLRDVSLRPGIDATGSWISGQVDMTSLAHHARLFVAFRYTGKHFCYRIRSVGFGISSNADEGGGGSGNEPPPTPAINWSTPSITVAGGEFVQGQSGSATIRFPYSNNPQVQTVTGISVTPSGIAAAGFAPLVDRSATLTAGSGEVVFTVSGTPTTAGQVFFVAAGLPSLTSPNDRVGAGVANAPDPPGGGDDPPGDDTPVVPPDDPDPVPIHMTWDFSQITQANWQEHIPVCGVNPRRSEILLLVENLTQHGDWSGESDMPRAGMWGGSGFNGSQYATFQIRCDTRRISLASLDMNVERSFAGPQDESLSYNIGGGWKNCSGNLSSVSELQNIPAGTAISFRVTPGRADDSSGTWHLTGLSIDGSYFP